MTDEDLVATLARLDGDEERHGWLKRHRDAISPALVEELCRRAAGQLNVDLELARRLAGAAELAAIELADPGLEARARRIRANVSHQDGDYARARPLYEAALDGFTGIGDQLQAAITRSSALHNLIYLGDYQTAHEWAGAAREVFDRRGDRQRLAILDLNYANVLYRQDRWHEAMELYRKSYEQFLAMGHNENAAICLRNMSVCQISLGNFEEAVDVYRRARDYFESQNLPLLLMMADYNIAYLHYQRGHYTQAIQLYQEARVRCTELGDQQHVALCDLDQSEIFLELNLVEEAEQLALWAYERFTELGMGYEAAKALTNRAIANARQGMSFLAVELLDKAKQLFVAEQNAVWSAMTDLYKATVLRSEGRLIEATKLARQSLDYFAASPFSSRCAASRILLAYLALEAGTPEAARGEAEAALATLRQAPTPALEYQAHFSLGLLAESLGQLGEAYGHYRETHERLERLRSDVHAEEVKLALLSDKLEVYERLVWLAVEGAGGDDGALDAFTFIEKAKARSLADLMAFRAYALPAKAPTRSDLVEEIRDLREELNWYYRQIDLNETSGDRAGGELDELRQKTRSQEEKLLGTLQELEAADQELGSLQRAATIDVDAIRREIPADTLLVEYYVARQTIFACVVGREVLEIMPLTPASRVEENHRLLQFQLSKFLLGREHVEKFSKIIRLGTEAHLRSLYAELMAPLKPLLGTKRLVIVPHGALHYLPFHALLDGDEYLIDRHVISYAPSASVYYLSRQRQHQDPRPDRLGLMSVGVDERAGARAEVAAVTAALGDAQVLLDREVTTARLRYLAERCRVLHLSTDGEFRQDNPMFSSLRLGSGRLNLFDLYNMRLDADLVTLTGCGLGLEARRGGDELVGLVRGLLFAGASAVLLDLWDSGGESKARFFASFYRGLLAGDDAGAALRRSALEVREENPHLFHWGSFVLVANSPPPRPPT